MSLTRHFTLGRRATRREAAARRPHDSPNPPRERPAAAPAPRPRRRLDRPQDAALFTCSCGFAWSGAVTTSVDCPHCGTSQAW